MKRDGRTEVVWRARGSKQGEDTRRNLDNNGGCSLWGAGHVGMRKRWSKRPNWPRSTSDGCQAFVFNLFGLRESSSLFPLAHLFIFFVSFNPSFTTPSSICPNNYDLQS